MYSEMYPEWLVVSLRQVDRPTSTHVAPLQHHIYHIPSA